MEVNGVSSQIPIILQTGTVSQTESEVQEPIREQPQSSDILEPDATEPEASDPEVTKGVIRNLLDGHFKGVADVRLRINHFEELEAIQGEELKAIAEEKVTGVLEAVGSGVDNILGAGELFTTEEASEDKTETVLELHQEFVDTVLQLKEDFQTAETLSAGSLVSGIQDAFAAFLESLKNLLIPTVEEESQTGEITITTATETQEPTLVETQQPTGDEPIVTELTTSQVEEPILTELEPPVVETPAADVPEPFVPTEQNYQGLIDELSNVFATSIAELTEALNGVQVLPELSEPSGNGVAYKKFLAIYNQMWNVESAGDDTASDEQVDTFT